MFNVEGRCRPIEHILYIFASGLILRQCLPLHLSCRKAICQHFGVFFVFIRAFTSLKRCELAPGFHSQALQFHSHCDILWRDFMSNIERVAELHCQHLHIKRGKLLKTLCIQYPFVLHRPPIQLNTLESTFFGVAMIMTSWYPQRREVIYRKIKGLGSIFLFPVTIHWYSIGLYIFTSSCRSVPSVAKPPWSRSSRRRPNTFTRKGSLVLDVKA